MKHINLLALLLILSFPAHAQVMQMRGPLPVSNGGTGSATGLTAPDGMVGFYPGITVPSEGQVTDMSGNANNLIYTSAMTDLIRDTVPGYISSAAATAPDYKAFVVPLEAFSPDVIGNNDSVFVSAVFNLPSMPATKPIMGNAADLSYAGISVYISSSKAGVWIKGTSNTKIGQSDALLTNTDYRLTLYIDGPTKRAFAWINGTMFLNNYDVSGLGSFYNATCRWAFGGGGGTNLMGGASQDALWKDITMIWLRSGGFLKSPAYLDWLLRTRPAYQLTKLDLAR